MEPNALSFMDNLGLIDVPLATLPQSMTWPSKEALEMVMEELR